MAKSAKAPQEAAANSETAPDGARTLQERGQQLIASLSESVAVRMRDPRLRHFTLNDLDWAVVPASLTNQFMIMRGMVHPKVEGEEASGEGLFVPVGLALWASVSDDVSEKLAKRKLDGAGYRLAPTEWKRGDKLWLLALATKTWAGLISLHVYGKVSRRQVYFVSWLVSVVMVLCSYASMARADHSLVVTYRLTVRYESGGAVRSTSGVIEASYTPSAVPNFSGIQQMWRGEAVRGEAADGNYFFVLNINPPGEPASGSNIVSDACGVAAFDSTSIDGARAWLLDLDRAFSKECSVPPNRWPIIAIGTVRISVCGRA